MTRSANQDRADVEQVFSKYVESIDAADVALAAQVWLQSPDVLVVTPFGRFKGWDGVRDDIYVNFTQKQLRQRNLHTSNVSIVVAGDAAWLVYDFAFTATLGRWTASTSNGWESHGYLRTVDGWRIAHLHYSVQPHCRCGHGRRHRAPGSVALSCAHPHWTSELAHQGRRTCACAPGGHE